MTWEFLPIFLRCTESKPLENSMKRIIASRFFAFTLSIILCPVKIWPTGDLFFLKPFWFGRITFSISGWIRFSIIELYIFAAMGASVVPPKLLVNERFSFLGKGSMHPLVQVSVELWLCVALHVSSRILLKLLVFHSSGGISSSLGEILFCNLFRTGRLAKCFFHFCNLSSWLEAFSFACEDCLRPLILFIVCQAKAECLFSASSFMVSVFCWICFCCSLLYASSNSWPAPLYLAVFAGCLWRESCF